MKPFRLALVLGLSSMPLMAADKHVHGEANLYIAIEGKMVAIELESPADNILGFEHQPKTKKQHQLVESASALLADYRNLVQLNDASCTLESANIEAPFAEEDNDDHKGHDHDKHGHKEHHDHDKHKHDHKEHGHNEHKGHGHDKHHDHHEKEHDHKEHHDHDKHHNDHKGHGHHGEHDEDAHADYRASYTLQCESLGSLTAVSVTAFDQFSGFETITVNWVTPSGQGSSKTTAKQPSVTLNK